MKNYFSFIAAAFGIIFLVASCGSSLTITKRHYNKGYYISFNKGKHSDNSTTEDQIKDDIAQDIVVKNESEKHSEFTVSEDDTNNDFEEINPEENDDAVASDNSDQKAVGKVPLNSSEKKQSLFSERKESKLLKHFSPSKIKNTLSDQSSVSSPNAHTDDGLSLLWIVILVVLILWLLGFLYGSFGGLIHLLLVIALILLILWLLGII